MKKLKFLKIKKSQNFCKNLQIKILVNLKSTPDLPPAWSAIDITGMMAKDLGIGLGPADHNSLQHWGQMDIYNCNIKIGQMDLIGW